MISRWYYDIAVGVFFAVAAVSALLLPLSPEVGVVLFIAGMGGTIAVILSGTVFAGGRRIQRKPNNPVESASVDPRTESNTSDEVPVLLASLLELHERGVLTEQEFRRKHRQLFPDWNQMSAREYRFNPSTQLQNVQVLHRCGIFSGEEVDAKTQKINSGIETETNLYVDACLPVWIEQVIELYEYGVLSEEEMYDKHLQLLNGVTEDLTEQ